MPRFVEMEDFLSLHVMTEIQLMETDVPLRAKLKKDISAKIRPITGKAYVHVKEDLLWP